MEQKGKKDQNDGPRQDGLPTAPAAECPVCAYVATGETLEQAKDAVRKHATGHWAPLVPRLGDGDKDARKRFRPWASFAGRLLALLRKALPGNPGPGDCLAAVRDLYPEQAETSAFTASCLNLGRSGGTERKRLTVPLLTSTAGRIVAEAAVRRGHSATLEEQQLVDGCHALLLLCLLPGAPPKLHALLQEQRDAAAGVKDAQGKTKGKRYADRPLFRDLLLKDATAMTALASLRAGDEEGLLGLGTLLALVSLWTHWPKWVTLGVICQERGRRLGGLLPQVAQWSFPGTAENVYPDTYPRVRWITLLGVIDDNERARPKSRRPKTANQGEE